MWPLSQRAALRGLKDGALCVAWTWPCINTALQACVGQVARTRGSREKGRETKETLLCSALPPGTEGQVGSSMELSPLKCLSPWEQSTPRESMEVERPGDTKQFLCHWKRSRTYCSRSRAGGWRCLPTEKEIEVLIENHGETQSKA